MAAFKAHVLNEFVLDHGITSVIEYGCGDGNQLALAWYPRYIGFDVSPRAVSLCRKRFAGDGTKSFALMETYAGQRAELTLSLDVIYHLVEDDVFVEYMDRLFDSSDKYVIIYSSNMDSGQDASALHVRHHDFSKWVAENKPDWELRRRIPNRYPFNPETGRGSLSDFYLYSRRAPQLASGVA